MKTVLPTVDQVTADSVTPGDVLLRRCRDGKKLCLCVGAHRRATSPTSVQLTLLGWSRLRHVSVFYYEYVDVVFKSKQ